MADAVREDALEYHPTPQPGKTAIVARWPLVARCRSDGIGVGEYEERE